MQTLKLINTVTNKRAILEIRDGVYTIIVTSFGGGKRQKIIGKNERSARRYLERKKWVVYQEREHLDIMKRKP